MKYIFITTFIIASICQGLYFDEQYIIANIILNVYALILYRRHSLINKGYVVPTFSLAMLTIIYVASIGYGINRDGAIYEALRIMGFLPAFYIGLTIKEHQKKWIEYGIIISGVVVTFIGFAALSGVVNIDGALYGQRMQSTFQYANVTALYLMIAIILCGKGTFCLPHFSLMLISILTCGLIFTYSRGVWIIFGVVNIFALLSKKMLIQKNIKNKYPYTLLIISIMVILLSSTNFTRLTHINFSATEWQARLAYYKGALQLIRYYPLVGVGAGGWQKVCEQYVGLYTKYVHNYFLQILCDVGFIGFIAFISFIVSVIYAFVKTKLKDWYALLIVLSIMMHSLIDVGMHFQLIAIIFFLYCGLITRAKDELENVTEPDDGSQTVV